MINREKMFLSKNIKKSFFPIHVWIVIVIIVMII